MNEKAYIELDKALEIFVERTEDITMQLVRKTEYLEGALRHDSNALNVHEHVKNLYKEINSIIETADDGRRSLKCIRESMWRVGGDE